MNYRVVIPTSGSGSRLGKLTRYINKSLVGIAHRPTISHLIEQFPGDCEFVIALGHKGNLVREYLELAHPDRQFIFQHVVPFEGKGSGLGLSLLFCEKYLQQPFIFLSCDTLVKEQIIVPDHNWMGYAQIENVSDYRTLELESDYVNQICEKGINNDNQRPYIGLSGIHDYQLFWKAMRSGKATAIRQGEVYGLRKILSKTKVSAYRYTWFDTGNPKALAITREAYRQVDEPNILEKENESIWFVGDKVIKFSDNKKFIANRIARAKELRGFIPNIQESRENMYRYQRVEGKVLSEAITVSLFDKLLSQCSIFWKLRPLNGNEELAFKNLCMDFYKDKTYERIDLFYKKFDKKDGTELINEEEMPLLSDVLKTIDWDWISNGLPGRFHGDFHFENIIWSKKEDKFTFLDWRQDFGGDLKNGDIYYDFAKLLHGLIVSHEMIARDKYSVTWDENKITLNLHHRQILIDCENIFNQWVKSNGYDLKKIRVLTALIYLNIAPLHHYPYSMFLYGFGKRMLVHELKYNF